MISTNDQNTNLIIMTPFESERDYSQDEDKIKLNQDVFTALKDKAETETKPVEQIWLPAFKLTHISLTHLAHNLTGNPKGHS